MIVTNTARGGSLFSYVGRPLFLLLIFDVAIASAYVFGGWTWLALPDVPLSIFGGVLGVIAGFRNTSAYNRWWEARIIWGAIVNRSRSFAREVLTTICAPDASPAVEDELNRTKRRLVVLQIAYVHTLRNQLRGVAVWPELACLLSEAEIEHLRHHQNVPLAIQYEIAEILAQCHRKGWLDTVRWVNLDQTLSLLMDSEGAAERIKNTPMPRLYDMFIGLFINIYCILLPLGMVASLKLWTPLGSALVGFMFLALDRIGRDLENPFENMPNDISLTAITRTIEINLKQMIGDREIPEPVAPVDGILW
jgi:putative membrane protein